MHRLSRIHAMSIGNLRTQQRWRPMWNEEVDAWGPHVNEAKERVKEGL